MKPALEAVIVAVYFQQLILTVSATYGYEIDAVRDEWVDLRKEDPENLINRLETLTINVKRLVDNGLIKPVSWREYKWKYGIYEMNYCLPETRLVGVSVVSLPSIKHWEKYQTLLDSQKQSEIDKKSDEYIKHVHERLSMANGKDKNDHKVYNEEKPFHNQGVDPFANCFKYFQAVVDESVEPESISRLTSATSEQTDLHPNPDTRSTTYSYSADSNKANSVPASSAYQVSYSGMRKSPRSHSLVTLEGQLSDTDSKPNPSSAPLLPLPRHTTDTVPSLSLRSDSFRSPSRRESESIPNSPSTSVTYEALAHHPSEKNADRFLQPSSSKILDTKLYKTTPTPSILLQAPVQPPSAHSKTEYIGKIQVVYPSGDDGDSGTSSVMSEPKGPTPENGLHRMEISGSLSRRRQGRRLQI